MTSTRSGFTPGVTTNTYSQRGELMQVEATGGTPFIRQFAANREGLITSRRENSTNKIQNYVYFQGAEVASIGNASTPEVRDAFITPWQQSDYVVSRTSSYGVSQGDTLASIARMIWGDSRMWYLIADANGLAAGANDPLEVGNTLRIPAVAGSSKNNATTFKPYDPSDIIGETSPNPKAPPPPKPPKKKCGGLGAIVMVVVAVVAVVVTAGAAAAAIGAASGGFGAAMGAAGASLASGSAFATGTAALTGGLGFGTALGAGLIGGAVGNALTQGVGMALGVVDKFSWRQVAAGGLRTALTAGLAGAAVAGNLGGWAKVAAETMRQSDTIGVTTRGIFNYASSQAVNRVAGLSTTFSWSGLAASIVGEAVAGQAIKLTGMSGFTGMPGNILQGFVSSASAATVNEKWFGGAKVDYAQIAYDAFGNAMAGYILESMKPKVNEPTSANPYAAANEKWGHGLASVDHSDPSALSTDKPTLREQMRQSGIEMPLETTITIIGDKDEPLVGGVPKGYFDPIVATPLPESSYNDYGNGYNYPVRLEDQTQQVIRQVTASLAERYLLWNNTSKSSIQKELVGLGALPATLKGVHDVWFGAQAAIYTKSFSANGTQYSAIGPDKTRYAISSQSGQVTGAILSNDQVKVPTYLKVGAQVASTLRQSALLSVAGTSLDYGIHEIAGIPKNQEGNPYRNFGADAFLDFTKAIPAGLAGAVTYGAIGTVVPGLGNLVGVAVGFGIGITTALAIETHVYEQHDLRNRLKGR